MTKLLDGMNPAVNFCRFFGMGLRYGDTTAYFVDAFFAFINILVFVYGYFHVTTFVAQKMPEIWDINAVVSVVRLYTHIVLPPLMVFYSQFKKITLNVILGQLDLLVPSINYSYLTSFMWFSCTWLLANISGEMLALTTFHMRTDFRYYSIVDYLLIVVFNFWTFIPILQYLFVIKTVNLGVRTINDRIVTFAEWKASRAHWKELRYLAVNLTNKEVGMVIIAHLVCKILDIIFFTFISYFYGYKEGNEIVAMILVVHVFILALWTFELIRQCQNCKTEMLRTQKILNTLDIKNKANYKELQFTCLYMLHTDFNFMPCGLFELNYRSLVKIGTKISTFVIFQIQMKLL